MNGLVDVIVAFLFLPMTVFIIIPLIMLCGWLAFKTVGHGKIKRPP